MSNLESICLKETKRMDPKTYKHWSITLQSILEKEDFWDLVKPLSTTPSSSTTTDLQR
uniref:DUF4219 domain-containing protein n=1 Tax=Physcomitrium patens TaxID=3218 RepID=A0A2K1K406_PHYPA|nr:hypothetical protein PHYPA_012988 [Physcomitrium patens]